MNNIRIVLAGVLLFVLAACSDDPLIEEPESAGTGERINVRMLFDDDIQPNEETTLRVEVKQAGEEVDDADEVMFEIWPHGRSYESTELEAEHEGGGIYASSFTFDEENLFYIQPRVTARDRQSVMLSELIVGDFLIRSGNQGNNEAEVPEELIAFFGANDELYAGEPAMLTVQVNWEDEPWTNGEVLFDLWQNGEEPDTLKTREVEPGTYELEHTFETSGKYHIMIHFHDETEELDAHIEDKLEVFEPQPKQ
ncbi:MULTISPECIES: FixH family protein [Alteribacter]|uniref:YtkA-like domain-containing protein n=1 Tax=Alteribacter keqinensis TaxID=2483800 RepID=A0A3M7TR08_9BACI|nr:MULTISPECIES: FixH family protein [Alteribacter]MBM7097726.1 FixH family protein [Alteribacter salitolerans]RNA67129.1 hypothetical protein EBO34_18260 [Alteribacter keqinensis]